MEKSETIGKIAEALSKAQSEMGNALFDSKNPHFNSKYASLASVNDAVKPLAKHGIAVIQSVKIDRKEFVLVTVTTMLLHASGEFLQSELSLKAIGDDAQKIGSVITYGRRYTLSAMCNIAADEDDDAEAATPKNDKKPETKKTEAKPIENKSAPKSGTSPAMKQRIEDLKKIHSISAKIGMTPEYLKKKIGEIIKRPFKESSELQDAELPQIIAEFEAELAFIEAQKKEAAGENNEQTRTTSANSSGDF